MIQPLGSELYHHGVKGMKWGVRKDVSAQKINVNTKNRKENGFYIESYEVDKNKRKEIQKIVKDNDKKSAKKFNEISKKTRDIFNKYGRDEAASYLIEQMAGYDYSYVIRDMKSVYNGKEYASQCYHLNVRGSNATGYSIEFDDDRTRSSLYDYRKLGVGY